MGTNNEQKKNDVKPTPRSKKSTKNEGEKLGNSRGSSRPRGKANLLCSKGTANQRSNFSNCKQSMEHSPSNRKRKARVQGSEGIIASTSSVYSRKMAGKGKIVVLGNQKGGVGKTFTTVHLAWYLAEKGYKVTVIDLDIQANASYSLSENNTNIFSSELFSKEIDVGLLYDNLSLISANHFLADLERQELSPDNFFKQNLTKIADVCDFILIDTPPSLGVGLSLSLEYCDYVISPIELEIYSLQGIKKMLTVIKKMKVLNPKLTFLGMLPSKVDFRNPTHKARLIEVYEAYKDMVIHTPIGLRSSISEALTTKKCPVWKIKKTSARKAVKEFYAFAELVLNKISENV